MSAPPGPVDPPPAVAPLGTAAPAGIVVGDVDEKGGKEVPPLLAQPPLHVHLLASSRSSLRKSWLISQ